MSTTPVADFVENCVNSGNVLPPGLYICERTVRFDVVDRTVNFPIGTMMVTGPNHVEIRVPE